MTRRMGGAARASGRPPIVFERRPTRRTATMVGGRPDMAIRIEPPAGTDALTDFILFHDEVYRTRSAHWPAFVPFQLPTLTGDGPFARERRLRPFVARAAGRIGARALAVIDRRYQHHWKEPLGH